MLFRFHYLFNGGIYRIRHILQERGSRIRIESSPDAAIVPQQIRDYVAKNFAGRKIVSIDRDKRDWEVKLDNGLDLKFDLQFRLIEIDD